MVGNLNKFTLAAEIGTWDVQTDSSWVASDLAAVHINEARGEIYLCQDQCKTLLHITRCGSNPLSPILTVPIHRSACILWSSAVNQHYRPDLTNASFGALQGQASFEDSDCMKCEGTEAIFIHFSYTAYPVKALFNDISHCYIQLTFCLVCHFDRTVGNTCFPCYFKKKPTNYILADRKHHILQLVWSKWWSIT